MAERIIVPERYESMRGWFAYELFLHMSKNENIWLLTGDLGFGMFDHIKDSFADRYVNVGASEQALVGIGAGLALKGKIPVVYSITPFLLYRPFETIRNYINQDQIPIKLIGSGRGKDYSHDGFSHWSEEDKALMQLLPNIDSYWPETKEDLPKLLNEILFNNRPTYLNLRR